MKRAQKAAILVEKTGNSKVGAMSATYAPISRTCPSTCALRDAGCYAQSSYVGMTNKRLEGAAVGMRARDVARAEASAIDGAFRGGAVPPIDGKPRKLRLHVSGDARERESASILAAAARRWLERGGGAVYTYTHAWRTVPREAWRGVSVLASVDSVSDGARALSEGYAPAVVVGQHHGDRAWESNGVSWIPCPSQTRGVSCVECRLCMRADTLAGAGKGIAFAAHGTGSKKIKRRLQVLT